MKGATAEPWVSTTRAPNSTSTSTMGPSHHFLRTRKKSQSSRTIDGCEAPCTREASPQLPRAVNPRRERPRSGRSHRGDDLLREGLELVEHVGREGHEDEVGHAGRDVALDAVEALLLVADHDLGARVLGGRLAHGGDEVADELLALRGGAIAERHEDRLLDPVGVPADRVTVPADQVDELAHARSAGAGVPHVGMAGDQLEQHALARATDEDRRGGGAPRPPGSPRPPPRGVLPPPPPSRPRARPPRGPARPLHRPPPPRARPPL